MPPALAVIGAVASVGGTLAAVNQQKKAVAFQQQAAVKQQEQQNLATRRSQRQAIREAQIRRAQAAAAAQGLGASGGSSIAGGTSQTGSALGFSTQMSGLSSDIAMLGGRANAAVSRANTFGAVAGIGSTLFQMGGGFSSILPGSTAGGNSDLLSGIA